MVRPLSDLIKDADEIIFGRQPGEEKTAARSEPEIADDDIFKLAELIRKAPELPEVAEKLASDDDELVLTMREKVAHAVALVDTLLNLPTLEKVAAFEDQARAAGYSDKEIAAQLEKTAGLRFRSVLSDMPWFQKES